MMGSPGDNLGRTAVRKLAEKLSKSFGCTDCSEKTDLRHRRGLVVGYDQRLAISEKVEWIMA
jgi:hypothetical protein